MGETFDSKRNKFMEAYAYPAINSKGRMLRAAQRESMKYKTNSQKISNRNVKTGKKTVINKPKVQQKQKFTGSRKKMIGGLVAAIAAGTLAIGIGANNAYQNSRPENQPITISQAIQSGDTAKSLGINEQDLQTLQNYQEALQNDDISNQELLDIATNIDGLQLNIIKSKVGNLLGVSPEKVKISATVNNPEELHETIKVTDEDYRTTIYSSRDLLDNVLGGSNKISREMSEYIRGIADMQDFAYGIQAENFDRDEVIDRSQEELEKTSQFAAGEMQIDDRGNISIDMTKVKDINNEKDDEQR